jgi:hypothetical protein
MSLPVYQNINVKSNSIEDLAAILHSEMNLKHPVVMNLKHLGMDDQREIIGLIENFFSAHNLSFKFPYPIYIICDHEKSITNIPVVKDSSELPKFYSSREAKMNVKESHLVGRNKLLQQEIKNTDTSANNNDMGTYAESHRIIYELETERRLYRSILNHLVKVTRHG